MEINGRPAAVQEWLTGLVANDWPTLVASPGVWYRPDVPSVAWPGDCHQWGLTHGALTPRSIVLTADGLVKITGLGEPAWLSGASITASAAEDVEALGRIAASWVEMMPKRKVQSRRRPLPASVRSLLRSLGGRRIRSPPQYSTNSIVPDPDVPSGSETWERLVKFAGENGSDGVMWRSRLNQEKA